LFITLFAAFQTLLARLTAQHDLVVGIPVEGRSSLETEGLVGLFVNLLPLCTDLTDGPTSIDLLERVRVTALSAYAHRDLLFEYLVETLRLPRDLSFHPLVQILFNMHESHRETLHSPGDLTLQIRPVPLHEAKLTRAEPDCSGSLQKKENPAPGDQDAPRGPRFLGRPFIVKRVCRRSEREG